MIKCSYHHCHIILFLLIQCINIIETEIFPEVSCKIFVPSRGYKGYYIDYFYFSCVFLLAVIVLGEHICNKDGSDRINAKPTKYFGLCQPQ